jgi:hypothetical protein
LAGITTQQPIDIYVDNTAPTLGGISIPTGTVSYESSVTCAVSGNASDAGSGIGAVDITLDSGSAGSSHQTVVPNAMGQWTANVVQYLETKTTAPFSWTAKLTIKASDVAGNTTTAVSGIQTYAPGWPVSLNTCLQVAAP